MERAHTGAQCIVVDGTLPCDEGRYQRIVRISGRWKVG